VKRDWRKDLYQAIGDAVATLKQEGAAAAGVG